MITNHILDDSKRHHYLVGRLDIPFGPFNKDGVAFHQRSFRHPSDYIVNRKGIYGENHVQQRKISCDVFPDPYSSYGLNGVITLRGLSSDGTDSGKKPQISSYGLSPAFGWRTDEFSAYSGSGLQFRLIRKLSPTTIETVLISFRKPRGTTVYYLEDVRFSTHSISVPKGYPQSHPHQEKYAYVPFSYIHGTSRPTYEDVKKLMPSILSLLNVETNEELIATCLPPGFCELTTRSHYVSSDSINNSLTPVLDLNSPYPPDVKSHGELVEKAVSTLDRSRINYLEFLLSFRKPWELIPKLKNLGTLRNAAENYLTLDYGILPTIDDINKLVDYFQSRNRAPYLDANGFQSLTSSDRAYSSNEYSTTEVLNRVKVAIDTEDPYLASIEAHLRDVGAFPKINHLWELVPFSFVLDWFVNIGDVLGRIDFLDRVVRLPIMYSTISTKIITSHDEGLVPFEDGIFSNLSVTYYDRQVLDHIPLPSLSFEASNPLPDHWLEAGALIIATKKHK